MCKRLSVLAVLMVSTAAIGIAALGPPVSELHAQPKNRVKWEYAELTALAAPQKLEVILETPTQDFQTKSYKEMVKKLGGQNDRDNSTDILNLLGAEGWELSGFGSFLGRDGKTVEYTWLFKRPK